MHIRTSLKAGQTPEIADQWLETGLSDNLQYLTLQQRMQDEDRRFQLESNILSQKHSTAANSIQNIR
jgi:hypothetical protein